MKVDIITITYNSVDTIEATLESVRKVKNFVNEYIVIDGKSTDGTVNKIFENSDIVDVAIIESDRGISHAFNKGIELSKADYVLLLNSNDTLVENAFETVLSHDWHNADIVLTPMLSWRGKEFNGVHRSVPSDLRKRSSVLHPGTIIKRAVYCELGGYSELYRIAMDYDFFCKCYVNNKTFKEVDIPLVNFDESGISSQSIFRIRIEGFKIRRKWFAAKIPWIESIAVVKGLLKYAARRIASLILKARKISQ